MTDKKETAGATKAAPKPAGYKVAKGVTLTSKRGMIAAGAEVQAAYLSGGQASIDALLKSKKIEKV